MITRMLSAIAALCLVSSSWASSLKAGSKSRKKGGITVFSQKLEGSPVHPFGAKSSLIQVFQKFSMF